MGRRNDHSRDEIRNMAIEAGIALLVSGGIADVSARKIAASIDYTVGTLYLVFENHDDLLLHINLRTLNLLHESLRECLDSSISPPEQLKKMATSYVNFAQQNENRWRLVYEHVTEIRTEVYDEYLLISKTMLELVETELDKLQQVDKPTLENQARALWGGIHGICILSLSSKLHHGDVPIYVMTDLLIEQFIYGMAGMK